MCIVRFCLTCTAADAAFCPSICFRAQGKEGLRGSMTHSLLPLNKKRICICVLPLYDEYLYSLRRTPSRGNDTIIIVACAPENPSVPLSQPAVQRIYPRRFHSSTNQRWASGSGEETRGPALINPSKVSKNPSYTNSGNMIVDLCSIIERPSFLDFIAGWSASSVCMFMCMCVCVFFAI